MTLRMAKPFAVLFFLGSQCSAGIVLFDQPTDTISVSGNTTIGTDWTYETQIYFSSEYQGRGFVFDEWRSAQENKQLIVGRDNFTGRNWPHDPLTAYETVTLNQWHHIAFVGDSGGQRLYLDGQRVATVGTSVNAGDGSGIFHVGAIERGSGIEDGIVGYLDALRISDVARYSGASFTAPTGDFLSDSDTLLLYNFNDAPGSSTATDSSGNGMTGTLGTGFTGATSPQFLNAIPEPSSLVHLAILASFGAVVYLRSRRRPGTGKRR